VAQECCKREKYSKAFEAKVEASGLPPQNFVFRPSGVESYGWFAFAKADKGGLIELHVADKLANIGDAETIWNMLDEFQYVVFPSQVHDGWMINADNRRVDAKLNGGAPVAISAISAHATTDVPTFWVLESDLENSFFASGYLRAFTGGSSPAELLQLPPKKNQRSNRTEIDMATCYLVAIGPDKTQSILIFPADCKVKKIDLRQILRNSTPSVGFRLGDFKHSFPDASDLGRNLKTLALAELRDYFQAEQDRAGDRVELPLVKLPAESVAYWGTATIFLLTTYLFAVFRDFRLRAKPDDKAWNTPWIGTSSECWSQGLFLATALLPSCTAAYLIFYGLGRSGWELRLLLAITAFILVGLPSAGIILSWRSIQPGDSVPLRSAADAQQLNCGKGNERSALESAPNINVLLNAAPHGSSPSGSKAIAE
jgi:hypothetical protein